MSLWALNKALKAHDRDLYAREIETGQVCVFRRSTKWSDPVEFEDGYLRGLIDEEQLVCSLTNTWGLQGEPVAWGIEPVLAHIKAIDLFNRDDIFEELMKEREAVREAKDRAFRNNTEAFLLDFRDDIKKQFSDVRTCNMDMSKDVRRKWEKRRLNHGYR